MVIEITDEIKLHEIADLFTKYYPFLKLEFFDQGYQMLNSSNDKKMLIKTLAVGEVRTIHHPTLIELHFWNKTGTVELTFLHKAGLSVQIYRRYGEKWIQTSGTDELTLEEQNSIGRADSEDSLHGTNRVLRS
jgi:hypothetical protein